MPGLSLLTRLVCIKSNVSVVINKTQLRQSFQQIDNVLFLVVNLDISPTGTQLQLQIHTWQRHCHARYVSPRHSRNRYVADFM